MRKREKATKQHKQYSTTGVKTHPQNGCTFVLVKPSCRTLRRTLRKNIHAKYNMCTQPACVPNCTFKKSRKDSSQIDNGDYL